MLDQGDIIYGIKSEKYPEYPCYGIVVSASCDIANSKVGKIYYLTALPFERWLITEVGFQRVFQSFVRNKEKEVETKLDGLECSWKVLQTFSYEDIKTVINSIECKPRKRIDILGSIGELFSIREKVADTVGRTELLCDSESKFSEKAVKFLKDSEKGIFEHLYFLPKSQIEGNTDGTADLIIDLQEIDYLTLEDYRDILTNGIDYLLLEECDFEKRNRWQHKFWLKCDMDYVFSDGYVISPRREHLIQRFSHVFNRIGIDYLSDSEYECIVNKIKTSGDIF